MVFREAEALLDKAERDCKTALLKKQGHDGGIDHPHRRVMTGSKRIHNLVPDASLPPPNEAIVTGGVGTIGRRQGLQPFVNLAGMPINVNIRAVRLSSVKSRY
jgi:hypothetical protein